MFFSAPQTPMAATHVSGAIAYRRGDAADARAELAAVDRVPARARLLEVALDVLARVTSVSGV